MVGAVERIEPIRQVAQFGFDALILAKRLEPREKRGLGHERLQRVDDCFALRGMNEVARCGVAAGRAGQAAGSLPVDPRVVGGAECRWMPDTTGEQVVRTDTPEHELRAPARIVDAQHRCQPRANVRCFQVFDAQEHRRRKFSARMEPVAGTGRGFAGVVEARGRIECARWPASGIHQALPERVEHIAAEPRVRFGRDAIGVLRNEPRDQPLQQCVALPIVAARGQVRQQVVVPLLPFVARAERDRADDDFFERRVEFRYVDRLQIALQLHE
ncbi:hypothetical protein [Burkholderia contaminans]|uniref:hypothetical protein n=1 Tax=Burkholderia contaminans TaxID=488447 RepID=UPI00158A8668|nr:hypothetical protein [Burkholderia contaminans]